MFTVSEVLEEVGNYENDGEMSENSEDEFDGYLEEDETEQRWSEMEMGVSNGSEVNIEGGAEGGDEDEAGGGDEDGGGYDDQGSEGSGDNTMDADVPSIPSYSMTPGCSVSLNGNNPLASPFSWTRKCCST